MAISFYRCRYLLHFTLAVAALRGLLKFSITLVSGPPKGGMKHEFTAQIFEIHVFTQSFSGIHVNVNLICVQKLDPDGNVGNFFTDRLVVSEVDPPICLDIRRALGQ